MGLALTDEDTRIERCNLAYAQLARRTQAELIGQFCLDITHPDDRAAHLDAVEQVRRDGRAAAFETRLLTPGGHIVHSRVTLSRSAPGKLFAVVEDVSERVRAEAALAARTRELESVMLATPAAIYVNDRMARRSVYANAGVTRLLGYSAEEIAAVPPGELMALLHPDDVPVVQAMLARADRARDGEAAEAEYRFRHKDGSYRWVADHMVPLARGPDGRAERVLGVAVDVTDRRTAQDALAESEARFRAVQETSIDGFMVLDAVRGADGGIADFAWRYVNDAGARIAGRPREWYTGRRLLAEFPGNRDEGLFEQYVRVVETGEPFDGEIRYSRDGVDVFLRVVATKVADGFAVSFADLSARRAAEERLRASERRFRAAIDAVEGILWTNSSDGRMHGEQPGWAALTGQRLEAYQGFGWAEAVHPDDAEATVAAWNAAVGSGTTFRFEHRVRRHDGVWRRFGVRAIPARNEDGRITEWVGVHTDITDRIAADDALAASEQRLRLGLEAGRMVAWDWDVDTGIANRSGSAQAIFGLPSSGADDFFDLIHPEDRAGVLETRAAAVRGERDYVTEFRVQRPDGSEMWISDQGQVVRDADGRAVRMVGVAQDVTARKTAEIALADSERRLRMGLEAGRMVAWEQDLRTRVAKRSDTVRTIFGLDTSGTDDFRALVHPDDIDRVLAQRDSALAGDTDFSIEFRLQLPDGRELWVSNQAQVARDESGTAVRLTGITQDVTARKTAEIALAAREAEARARSEELHAVLDAAQAAIWIAHDPDCRVVTGNRFAAELIGLAGDENHSWAVADSPLAARVLQSRDGREIPLSEMPLQRACRGENDPAQELTFRGAGGPEVTLFGIARAFKDENGRPRGAVFVAVDLTARKAAEAQLRAALAEVEAVLEAVPAAVFIARDPECLRIDTNRYARQMLRLPQGARASKSAPDAAGNVGHYDMLSPEGEPLRPEQLPSQRAARGETVRDLEIQLRFATSETLWVLNNATPLYGAEGALIGSVSASVDITARKSAEEALRRLNASLADQVAAAVAAREAALQQMHEMQKLETIGQLTGGIAHDFNNLLTPIVAGLDMLQRRFKDDERAVRLLSGAQQSAERARVLVSRLLAFARRQLLDPRPVNMTALVAGMRDLIERSLGPQVEVTVEVARGLPPARVDANQLELALLNLCVNARDAMPGGGKLTIAADVAEEAERVEAGLSPGRYVRLCVVDSGVGMTPETLQRAIEPFYTTKGIGKGTGLGLSMVHGLAFQSGGAFHLKSAPDEGTTATIWLPASADAAAAGNDAGVEELAASRPLAVLLVDDEELVREAAAEMMASLGHGVTQAASGEEALELMRGEAAFDLLLTDYLMPGMTGAELVAAARALRPGLPAALVTGYARLTEAESAGLPRLHKPFRVADLARLVADVVGEGDSGTAKRDVKRTG